jgi:hypothetical protein
LTPDKFLFVALRDRQRIMSWLVVAMLAFGTFLVLLAIVGGLLY